MAQQTIDVGNYASDGTGDPLREAFTKVNDNFTELYSGNVQLTAANVLVFSVAGRTGNVVLTVNDVAQAASRAYVNTAISSNIAALLNSMAYTPANPSHWVGTITNVQQALDQLAERIWSIENQ